MTQPPSFEPRRRAKRPSSDGARTAISTGTGDGTLRFRVRVGHRSTLGRSALGRFPLIVRKRLGIATRF